MAVLLLSAVQIVAQTLKLTVEFPKTDDVAGMKIFVAPFTGGYVSMDEMTAADNKFTCEVEASPYGFYALMSVKSQTQFTFRLYVPTGTAETTVKAQLKEGNLINIMNSADNEALANFNLASVARDRKLWMEQMDGAQLREMYGDYAKLAADADPANKASKIVKDYLKIWSYVSTYNAVASLPRVLKVPVDSVPFKCGDVLPEPTEVLDCELATIFGDASNIIMRRMPEGKLAERIDWLRANYKTEKLCNGLELSMLNDYVSKFDYFLNFDKGFAEIKEVVAKYGYDKKYVENFEKYKIATKGSAFPAEVVLKDVDGNVVDFSKFLGKYVYIDLWASWCVPCCKEVPALQKLEKELQNDNVVFVSISLDSTEAPWKKKMTELNMHGNQLYDSSKKLTDVLNIKGIPHFLVYDKEGKLYLYNAPRPSAGGIRYYLEDLK